MLEQKSKVINSTTYKVTQLGTRQGSRVLVRVANKLGALGSYAGTGVEAAIGGVLQSLTEDDFNFLVDTFIEWSSVSIAGKDVRLKDIYEVHFAGKYLELFEWLAFCFEVNFADFLEGMTAKLSGLGVGLPKA